LFKTIFKIKWPHTEFALLNFSYELLIIVFFQQPMKGVETGVCQNKNGGTRTLVDSDILNNLFLTSENVFFDLKQDSLFNMIYFPLEKNN